MRQDTFAQYLTSVEKNLTAGNATEHTHRPALKVLLEELGLEVLGANIIATNEPKRIACGAPDFIVVQGQVPLGYVEAKDVGISLDQTEKTEQLSRYFDSLANLVLTDYLQFRWYVDGEHRLTTSIATWKNGKLKRSAQGISETRDLIKGFLTTKVPTVGTPEELAKRLAGIARLTKASIESALAEESEAGALHEQMNGFKEVLLHDLTEAQFADMFAQTLCYGLFAARCNSDKQPFTRQQAAYDLPKTNPFLRQMFSHVAGPDLDDRIVWAVDDLAELLNRADMKKILADFGKRTRREDPVVHFYETFLKAYDSKLRELRGVYYTPEPVVSYIVRSVDLILQKAFALPQGLADNSKIQIKNPEQKGKLEVHKVLVLDPAVGTGTFLYGAVDLIQERMKVNKGMWSSYVSEHLLPRLFGFELLMAPYAVAHMKLGIQLAESGYDFAANERLRVYLTNTLEEAHALANLPLFAKWLAEEANEASRVKQAAPVMVVLGNPPYSGHSANTGEWIAGLLRGKDSHTGKATSSYFEVDGKSLGERNPKWLNDDYVKFIRFAQWRIEQTGYGILAFITNHGYLDNPTFRGMRQSLLETFDDIYVLDLHGNTKKKEKSPDGSVDRNVFDIQQGVAIGIFVRKNGAKKNKPATVRHAHRWGELEIYKQDAKGNPQLVGGKYGWLWQNDVLSTDWSTLEPTKPFYLFIPQDKALTAEYENGWKITELMPVNVLGFQTHRDHFAIAFDKDTIAQRMGALRNTATTDDALRDTYDLTDNRDWQLSEARTTLYKDKNWKDKIIPCLYRPFDERWCYFDAAAMDYPRRELLDHVADRENLCLLVPRQLSMEGWQHAMASRKVAESCVVSTKTKEQNYCFPLYVYPHKTKTDLFAGAGRKLNVREDFLTELEDRLGVKVIGDGKADRKASCSPEDIVNYMYAILHSDSYRERYSPLLKADFPRIPFTSDKELFFQLAVLGEQLLRVHLMETSLKPVTNYPVAGDDIVKVIKFEDSVTGGRVWINDTQFVNGVAKEWWDFEIGGYQIAKKWLQYRKDRQLKYDDLTAYQYMIAAIAETSKITAKIDDVIEDKGGWPL